MKILFICSGNYQHGISPFISSQGESLQRLGAQVGYYRVEGKGVMGYLGNASRLSRYLKTHQFDLVHAHYNLSGLLAIIAAPHTLKVLSLMGDDAYGTFTASGKRHIGSFGLMLLTQLIQPFFSQIIAKSNNIAKYVYLKDKLAIIPNGVDLNVFKTLNSNNHRKKQNHTDDKRMVLFLSDPNDPRKDFFLAKNALQQLSQDVQLECPYPIPSKEVVSYMNAADVLISTSTMEGSPNLIKEAMACNCPIVTTDVGDVRWVIGETEGCYITSFDPEDVAAKIKLALEFSERKGRTNGRERIIELGLDSETVARKIIQVYKNVLSSN